MDTLLKKLWQNKRDHGSDAFRDLFVFELKIRKHRKLFIALQVILILRSGASGHSFLFFHTTRNIGKLWQLRPRQAPYT